MKIDSDNCAISMASTWIWAPALFVSSSIAYNYGILGLLLFLVPNVLTLFLFGYIAQKAIKKRFITKSIGNFGCIANMKKLQLFVAIFLQICSMLVQTMGINLLLGVFNLSTPVTLLISAIYLFTALAISLMGFKTVVNTDMLKYIFTLGIGAILLYLAFMNNSIEYLSFDGFKDKSYLISFGIITSIGLLTAPYIDETFWQRALSVEPDKIFTTFIKAGLFFFLVPFVFGCIGLGFSSLPFIEGWNISDAFKANPTTTLLLVIAVSSTLLSTLDSSASALYNLLEIKYKSKMQFLLYLLLYPCILILAFNLTKLTTITTVFLFYGTVRTCMFIPIVFYIFSCKVDWGKMYIYSLIAVIFSLIVYPLLATFLPDYSFIGVLTALVLPSFAYRKKQSLVQ